VERFDALGQPGLRETILFVRASVRPVTAAGVASALGVPRTAARWRLERLADAGLLLTGFERRTARAGPGAGRPAKTYAVAAETSQIEFPPRRYEQLIRLLVDTMPPRGKPTRLAGVGREFGRELARAAQLRPARTLASGLQRACAALGRLGFQASVASVSEDAAVLTTPTCPLRPLVVADTRARAIDEGMWSGLVAAALRGTAEAAVRCRTHECHEADAPCRIEIRLARRRARAD